MFEMRRSVVAAGVLLVVGSAVSPAGAAPPAAAPLSTTYGCTGSQQFATVPTGAATLVVTAAGAQGGSGTLTDGGLGGTVTTTVPIGGAVKAGDTLTLYVGCTPTGMVGGFGLPPGGRGGVGGGGASAVVDTSVGTPPLVIAVAAAGGGGNGGGGSGGGAGGYPSGTAGDTGSGGSSFASGGGGATTTASGGSGGAGGVGYSCLIGHCFASGGGNPGAFLAAGDGDSVAGGGGGGGGWYGGGGGGGCERASLAEPLCFATPGAGGGGSSYFGFAGTTTTATNAGNGAVTLTFPSAADVSVLLTAVPKPVTLFAPVTYTVTVHNAGPDAAQAAHVSVALPADRGGSLSLFVFAASSIGACAGPPFFGTGAVSCQLGNLAPGASATIHVVTLQIALPGSAPTATATVSSGTPDPNPANNSASTAA